MTYTELVTAVSDYCENTFPTVDMNTMIQLAEQRIYNTAQLSNLRKTSTLTLTSSNQYVDCPTDFLATYSLAIYSGSSDYTFLLNKDTNFMQEAYPKPATTGTPKHYSLYGPSSPVTTMQFSFGPTPDAAYSAELQYFYYPESIIQRPITVLGTISNAGSGYTAGTYLNVALTGGSGTGATANVVVAGGVVTSVTLVNGGTGFVAGEAMSASTPATSGTVFSIPISTVGNALGTTWLGTNFNSVLFNGTMVEAIRYMKGEQDLVALYQSQYQESMLLLKNLGDGKQRMDAYRDGQNRTPVV